MGSPAITIPPSTHRMSLFKALLFLPALSVVARAAPTEVVAGRVVTHAVPSLSTLHHTRTVPTHALHSVHAVPAVHAVHAVSPAVTEVRLVKQENNKVPAQYNIGYSITDSVTGDSKSRQESRDGDAVTGSYSVADPDGRIRTVTYTADALHGFQATVTYDGAEGPVAIPFNTPSEAVAVRAEHSNEESEIIKNNENVITAVRTAPTPELPNTDTTVRAVPTVQEIQTLHSLGNSLTAVRTVPNVLNVAAVPSHDHNRPVTVVRTLPTVQLPHAVHNLSPRVTAFRTLQGVPANLSSVRTIQGVPQGLTAVRTVPGLQTIGGSPIFLRNSNIGTHLDLSQFQFLNTGRVL